MVLCTRLRLPAIFVFLGAFAVRNAAAASFLAKLDEPELKRVLIAEIESALGGKLNDVTKRRLGEIEDALRPTFSVLPKDGRGRLGHDAVRYLLNRFFSQQHGWFVNGLQTGGGGWNSSSSKLAMRDYLPEVLQELFEQKLGKQGVGLQEVASFAAMIEHLIRNELRGKLELVYEAKQVTLEQEVNQARALELMEAYMICFLQGQDAAACVKQLPRLERSFGKRYPAWPEVKALIKEVVSSRAGEPKSSEVAGEAGAAGEYGGDGSESSYGFQQVSDLLEIVADRFSKFYEAQCSQLEHSLVELEDDATSKSGRVPLASFYKAALHHGKTSFLETPEVLRSIGALDETDASQPKVIIPNYVNGLSNCVARTSFYSTCCPSKCESLLDSIESNIGKAEATVDDILPAVAELRQPDGTAAEPPSPWLKKQLDAVAQHHGGGPLPLHGRLFQQWMHFMYPRDCMYPHVAGSTYKKSLDEWAAESGLSPQLNFKQLRDITEQLRDLRTQVATGNVTLDEKDVQGADEQAFRVAVEDTLEHQASGMWTMEEELLAAPLQVAEFEDTDSCERSWSTRLATGLVAFLLLFKVGSIASSKGGASLLREKESFAKYSV